MKLAHPLEIMNRFCVMSPLLWFVLPHSALVPSPLNTDRRRSGWLCNISRERHRP